MRYVFVEIFFTFSDNPKLTKIATEINKIAENPNVLRFHAVFVRIKLSKTSEKNKIVILEAQFYKTQAVFLRKTASNCDRNERIYVF